MNSRCSFHPSTVLGAVLSAGLMAGGAAFGADWHYDVPPFDCIHPDYHVPPVLAAAPTEFWVFSSVIDQTITDPTRPPWVLGPSGPWNITTTYTNPFGVVMPFLGTHFVLEPGGMPVGPEGAWFITATMHIPHGVTETVTDYWRQADGQIGMHSAIPAIVPRIPVPSGMQAPEAYYFIVDLIPAPGSMSLLFLGGLMMSRRRR